MAERQNSVNKGVAPAICVTSNGVGVANSNPQYPLDVAGMTRLASLYRPSWTSVSFCNSWYNYSTSAFFPVQYLIDATGRVNLRGFAGTSTGNTNPIFYLPPAYWPSQQMILPASSGTGTTDPGLRYFGTNSSNSSVGSFVSQAGSSAVSFDGVSFYPN
jgi:hypothetical protein